MPWLLYRTNDLGEWGEGQACDSLASAARRIMDIEKIARDSLSLHLQVDAWAESDEEALGHFEYQGRHALFMIRRAPIEADDMENLDR